MEYQTKSTKNYNPSAIMSAMNYARSWGRRTGLTTDKRVHKAFGYLQSGKSVEKWLEYGTTMNDCKCKDQVYRPQFICNHRVAKLLDMKHDEIMVSEGYWQEAA